MVRVLIVQIEDIVGVIALVAYLWAYLWQGRDEWYRNFVGRAMVTLGALALYRYVNGLFPQQYGPISLSIRNIVFYGAVDLVFAYLAIGIWRSGARAHARDERDARHAARDDESVSSE